MTLILKEKFLLKCFSFFFCKWIEINRYWTLSCASNLWTIRYMEHNLQLVLLTVVGCFGACINRSVIWQSKCQKFWQFNFLAKQKEQTTWKAKTKIQKKTMAAKYNYLHYHMHEMRNSIWWHQQSVQFAETFKIFTVPTTC